MLVLASTSTIRQLLLTNAGLSFRAISPAVDERQLVADNPQWTDYETSHHLARAKAVTVSKANPGSIVVGADQVLSLDGQCFNKPRDIADCRHQLKLLRGQTHALISTVCCAFGGVETWSCTKTAHLTMRHFSSSFLDQYLEQIADTCTTSVGGYKLEEQGIQVFDRIEGDYFTILGLPLLPLLHHLRFIGEIPS